MDGGRQSGTDRRNGVTASVGALLSRTRKARRISQLALAGEAGVSARHLSFIETLPAGHGGGLLVSVAFRQPQGGVAQFMTTLATVGTAHDLTLRELRIETFRPI